MTFIHREFFYKGQQTFILKGQDNRTDIPKRDVDGSDQSADSTPDSTPKPLEERLAEERSEDRDERRALYDVLQASWSDTVYFLERERLEAWEAVDRSRLERQMRRLSTTTIGMMAWSKRV